MFCSNCGAESQGVATFCGGCGANLQTRTMPPPPPSTQPATSSNGYSIAGIVCGALAFLVLPIVLGPAGLILGAVGKSKNEEKATIAMVVSGLGLVVGMFLGYVVWSSI